MPLVDVPENGDVVIRLDGSGVAPAYLVRAVPGPDQFRCATRAEATRIARSYADHAGVNVWFAEGSNRFTLMARGRGPGASRAQQVRVQAVGGMF